MFWPVAWLAAAATVAAFAIAVARSNGVVTVLFGERGDTIERPEPPKVSKVTVVDRLAFGAIAHAGAVWGVAVSGDQRHIVSAGDDGLVAVWDATARPLQRVGTYQHGHGDAVCKEIK